MLVPASFERRSLLRSDALRADLRHTRESSRLEAVLADIGARDDIDGVYHLGDLVGYGKLSRTRSSRAFGPMRSPGISGNYDSTVAMDYKHCGCRADTPHDEELAHISFEEDAPEYLAGYQAVSRIASPDFDWTCVLLADTSQGRRSRWCMRRRTAISCTSPKTGPMIFFEKWRRVRAQGR